MKKSVFSTIILTFALTIFCEGQSNSWNGVTPLLSTRADVEKLFGSLNNCESDSCTIKTPKEVVSFDFALGDCKEGWNIPKDTVLSLAVTPNSDVGKSFDELKLDRTGFTLSVDDAFSATWTNAAKGLQYSFSNVEREFRAAFYIPKKSDNSLRCDGFPAFTPEGSHYTSDIFRFNKYGNPKINLNWVYAHLDNLIANLIAQNINNSDEYRGYILVYFDAKQSFKKYKSSLNKIRKFVLDKKISTGQVSVIEGGMRQKAVIEFYLLPKSWEPPAPDPTLPSPSFRSKRDN